MDISGSARKTLTGSGEGRCGFAGVVHGFGGVVGGGG
ncbi:transcriptional regulator [Streptomyces sp. SPB78]|nr:transcriptional regulator [Streptomyces sp. SPB78]